jgi:hypothetical protein
MKGNIFYYNKSPVYLKLSISLENSKEIYGFILFENYDESELFYDDEPIVDFLDKFRFRPIYVVF